VAISAKLLDEGEHVVLSTRTHVKVLFGAPLVLPAKTYTLTDRRLIQRIVAGELHRISGRSSDDGT
jgi:hypothetical protein